MPPRDSGRRRKPRSTQVTAINAATPDGAEGKTALSIAVHALSGEIATRRGDLDAGINHFREAAKIEDAGLYFEPPKWYYPIRHSLGAALLKAGQHAEAEKVYREDLRRFPENGWSLFGLAQALRAQGKNDRSGRSGSALPPCVGKHGRDADGIEVLAN